MTSRPSSDLTTLLLDWQARLQGWAKDGSLAAAAREALQLEGEPEILRELIAAWSQGDFRALPPVVLLSAQAMNGAMGAYAISTGTIYLNQDWLVQASSNDAVSVLTEELGHHLDGLLNALDTPGDEGEYFARLLSGRAIDLNARSSFKNQSDAGLISVNGVLLVAERASGMKIRGNSAYQIFTAPSWTQAESASISLGGHLTAITSQEESTWICQNLLSNTGPDITVYYIGLSDTAIEGNPKWSSSELRSFDYFHSTYNNTAPASQANDFFVMHSNCDGIPGGGDGWINVDDTASWYRSGKSPDVSGIIQAIAEIPFIRRGDSAYVIVPGPTWEEAEANAVKLGGHLVTINTADENQWLSSLTFRPNTAKAASYWIGLTDRIAEGTWQWISGEPTSFIQWNPGEPSSNNSYAGPEDYAVFGSNTTNPTWIDVANSNAFYRNLGWESLGIAEIKLSPNRAPTGTPAISGTSTVGSSVTLDWSNVQDPDNVSGWTPTFVTSWEYSSDGNSWSKLTSPDATDGNNTYSVTSAEAGKRIRGIVSYMDGYGSNETVTSAASAVIGSSNQAPTNLFLTATSFNEGIPAGTIVATLTGNDPDPNDSLIYTLVSGTGSTDNNAFSLLGNQLRINASPNFEAKPTYSIRAKVSDAGGLSFEKAFTLGVDDVNEAPTDLSLSTTSVSEATPRGSIVATLSANDPDVGSSFSYSLVPGAGATDNGLFVVNGNELRLNHTPNFLSKPAYNLRLRATDAGGLWVEKAFTLSVVQSPQPLDTTAPTLFAISPGDGATGVSSDAQLELDFSEPIKAGLGRVVVSSLDRRDVLSLDPTDASITSFNETRANLRLGSFLKPGRTYTVSVQGNPFQDITGNAWPGFGALSYDFSTAASLNKDAAGKTVLTSSAGSLVLKDAQGKQTADFSGDSRLRNLRDLLGKVPFTPEAKELLDRYRVNSNGSASKASESTTTFIDFSVNTGALREVVAEIELPEEVKANAYAKVNPNTGEAYDFTYDPLTGLGAELLDSNSNSLVDRLRIHLRDGDKGDVDGLSNGVIRDPGVLADAPRLPVYRFFFNSIHFYTTSEAERDSVISKSYAAGVTYDTLKDNPGVKDPITGGWGYRYEGVAYQALDTQGTALHRFYNPSKGYHFMTKSAEEAQNIINNSVGSGYNLSTAIGKPLLSNGWGYQYEGTSYKVSTIPQFGMETSVYRFYNESKGVHFYSANLSEVKNVISNSVGAQYANDLNAALSKPTLLANGWGYQYEGVGWYV